MFWVIVLIAIASIWAICAKPTKLGLDLAGGSRLVLEAEATKAIPQITDDVMNTLQFSIENRVNKLGVSETIVQRIGEKRLMVEIPGETDLKKAKMYIGETAQLEFKKPGGMDKEGNVIWLDTDLTGRDLTKSTLTTDSMGQWVVGLEFNSEGSRKFAELTKELVGKEMAIFFNGDLQSAPRVNEPIYGGHAQITGGGESGFSQEEAQEMVNLLNAGALPVPAKIVEENTVGATLGADSIAKSKFAGIVGLGLVMLFMIFMYRAPGVIADIALVIYSLILFALFKTIPVTLTLAGIAGFILSIGMAVDANILIFERMKEELKAGRNLFTAINSGFDRAWTSILDSNMTTIIACVILYYLGSSVVKGFALTLAMGVIISMFSAITITKNFMHLIFGTGELKYPALFGLKASEIGQGYKATETKRENARFGILD
jgi:preprotein translocase subunit SecD